MSNTFYINSEVMITVDPMLNITSIFSEHVVKTTLYKYKSQQSNTNYYHTTCYFSSN